MLTNYQVLKSKLHQNPKMKQVHHVAPRYRRPWRLSLRFRTL